MLFQTRRQIRDAGLIFACAGADVLAMLNKQGQHEFQHFTTLDLALEQCENLLLRSYGEGFSADINPPSPVMLKPAFGKGARDGLLLRDPNNVCPPRNPPPPPAR